VKTEKEISSNCYIEELHRDVENAKQIFSTWFFDDKDRMHFDLLTSEPARRHIDTLFEFRSIKNKSRESKKSFEEIVCVLDYEVPHHDVV
jgi:hypothetical protein